MVIKNKKSLVKILEQIFTGTEIIVEGGEFNEGKDYVPPISMDWYGFIKILEENGLGIGYITGEK